MKYNRIMSGSTETISFTDKLQKLKATCEERISRIKQITNETNQDLESIKKIKLEMQSEYDVATARFKAEQAIFKLGML